MQYLRGSAEGCPLRALKPTDIPPDQQRITFDKIELIAGTLADACVREGATRSLTNATAKAKGKAKGKAKAKAGTIDNAAGEAAKSQWPQQRMSQTMMSPPSSSSQSEARISWDE